MLSPDHTASGTQLVVHSKGEHPPHPALQNTALETAPNPALLSPSVSLLSETSVSPPSQCPTLLCRCTFEAFGVCDESSPLPFFVLGIGKGQSLFPGVGRKNIWLAFPS